MTLRQDQDGSGLPILLKLVPPQLLWGFQISQGWVGPGASKYRAKRYILSLSLLSLVGIFSLQITKDMHFYWRIGKKTENRRKQGTIPLPRDYYIHIWYAPF